MPSYDKSPFKPVPQLLVPGLNTYLFGSRKQNTSPTKFEVQTVAIASDVATVTGVIEDGEVPVVGSLISIRGTQTSSGAFNVTNVALASVSFVPATSVVTVTFALTAANVATTNDAGTALIPQPEVAENVTSGTASVACAVYNNERYIQGGRQVSAYVSGTAALELQGADVDQDSEYTTLAACTANQVTQYGPYNFRFYRFMPTSTGTAVARIAG